MRSQYCPDIHWVVVGGGSIDGTVDELTRSNDVANDMISEPHSGIYYA